jgi:hypothetical protein
MAKPRIFISSTYYDLKHIRYSLDIFISNLGYETILSEKGDIAYAFDLHLDESCYKEVNNVDIFVLIIGGRYGSEVSNGDKKPEKKFYDRYESITKREFDTAINKDIPTYILIESNVYSEYRTFLKNKTNDTIKYAHVDSVNIFHFIEEIMSKPRNNPIKSFEKFDEIEYWLKEQWAGLFKDLILRRVNQNQIKNLTSEIGELQDINKTLKTYLEEILKANKSLNSDKVIKEEDNRLSNRNIQRQLNSNRWYKNCTEYYDISQDDFIENIKSAKDLESYIETFKGKFRDDVASILHTTEEAVDDLNSLRKLFGKSEI